jgi:hypothetical protein
MSRKLKREHKRRVVRYGALITALRLVAAGDEETADPILDSLQQSVGPERFGPEFVRFVAGLLSAVEVVGGIDPEEALDSFLRDAPLPDRYYHERACGLVLDAYRSHPEPRKDTQLTLEAHSKIVVALVNLTLFLVRLSASVGAVPEEEIWEAIAENNAAALG